MNIRARFVTAIEATAPSARAIYHRWRDHRWLRHPYQLDGYRLFGDPRVTHLEQGERNSFESALGAAEVFVDVGANIGFYTCLALSRGKRTVSIEPLARNLQFLYRNLVVNGFVDTEVFPLAVGARPSVEKIFGFADIASLLPDWGRSATETSEYVSVTTLDILLEHHVNKALLIKIDVEGTENDVLEGATRLLNADRSPTWIVEILPRSPMTGRVNSRFRETFDVFMRAGYSVFHAEGMVPIQHFATLDGGNFIFQK